MYDQKDHELRWLLVHIEIYSDFFNKIETFAIWITTSKHTPTSL